MENMNSIAYIKSKFSRLSLNEKSSIKRLGRDKPFLTIVQNVNKGKYKATRRFKMEIYNKAEWLTGCPIKNAFFCFPCTLMGGSFSWTVEGITDLKHLTEKIRDHSASKHHIRNISDFDLLGTADIAQLDSAHQQLNIKCHNEQVDRNRHILLRLIDCNKFWSSHELRLGGQCEKQGSLNRDVFQGLVDMTATFDPILKENLDNSTLFREKFNIIQDELHDCMLHVCRELIHNEIDRTKFIAIQVEEITDVSNKPQFVMIFRYLLPNLKVVERFYGFINPKACNAESLASIILEQLGGILGHDRSKLICQIYDGTTAFMNDEVIGVHKLVKERYPWAHFVHSYTQKLDTIMLQAASCCPQVRRFFLNLKGFSSFFTKSSQRIEMLDEIETNRRSSLPSNTRWNFNSRLVETVYEYRDILEECLETLADNPESNDRTVREATGLLSQLNDETFLYWLETFNILMPHVDLLSNRMQTPNCDSDQALQNLNNFERAVRALRTQICEEISALRRSCCNLEYSDLPSGSKRRKLEPKGKINRLSTAVVVCDIIMAQARRRYSFRDHLTALKLFDTTCFQEFSIRFPFTNFQDTVAAYSFLESQKLRIELMTIYQQTDFSSITGTLPFLTFLHNNNLVETYPETTKLLTLLITIPITSDAECFSTLEKVGCFVRSTITQDRLNALTMLSVEKEMIENFTSFNDRVMEKFSFLKERSIDFHYKC